MECADKNVYVLIEPSVTRLGNWMFQYAAARAAEPAARISFFISNRAEWADVERRHELFPDVTIVDRVPEGVQIRRGLFQEARYVPLGVVRELYRCPPRVAAYLQWTYGELLGRPNLVSIHVRRGDYLELPHRHPFVGAAYLQRAVKTVCEKVAQPTFVVCSDDLPWCKSFFTASRFPGLEFCFAADDGGVMGDLFLMSRCHHHICSNSTFSWWGAYLGVASQKSADNPITIFPSMWFGLQLRHENWQGLYFDGCTVLHNGYKFPMLVRALAHMAKTMCGDILRALHLRKRWNDR